MEPESRTKTFLMVLGLAAFMGVGAACFSLFRSHPPTPVPSSCEGLQGQARTDCENQQGR